MGSWANLAFSTPGRYRHIASSDIKRPKSEAGPSATWFCLILKKLPIAATGRAWEKRHSLFQRGSVPPQYQPAPPSAPCLQTTVLGADRPSQFPPSPGGLRGDVHQEPQPDGLWQRADRESPAKTVWFLVLGAPATRGQRAGKCRCVRGGIEMCLFMMKCFVWKPFQLGK